MDTRLAQPKSAVGRTRTGAVELFVSFKANYIKNG
jgi:hypothetical protein